MQSTNRPPRCGWCNGWLTPSSDALACPHPDALAGAPPRPKTPPVIFDALPPQGSPPRINVVRPVLLPRSGIPRLRVPYRER